jgi:hypothetical protein
LNTKGNQVVHNKLRKELIIEILLTVRLFWKLIRRFGSLVYSELTSGKLDHAFLDRLELWWQIAVNFPQKWWKRITYKNTYVEIFETPKKMGER